MLGIVGLFLLIIIVVMGLGSLGDRLAYYTGFRFKKAVKKQDKIHSHNNEKATSVYTAAGKSFRLKMMQMDSLRQMEEAARRYRR